MKKCKNIFGHEPLNILGTKPAKVKRFEMFSDGKPLHRKCRKPFWAQILKIENKTKKPKLLDTTEIDSLRENDNK